MDLTNKTVYNVYGRVGKVIGRYNNEYIVATYVRYYDEQGEEFQEDGPIEIWQRVFEKPPRSVLHEQVASLKIEVEGLRKQKRELEQDLRAQVREIKNQLERLKKFKPLEYLEDFLDGKFTHVLYRGYGEFKIYTKEQLINIDNRFDKGFKLLTLFGRTNGDLQWRINQYSDGSGMYTDVILFKSYEEALEALKEILAEKFSDTEKGVRYIKVAEEHEIDVPQEVLDARQAAEIKKAQEDREKKLKEVEALEKRLAEAEQGLFKKKK